MNPSIPGVYPMVPRGSETLILNQRERDTEMAEFVIDESTQEPLDEEERELIDPATWYWDSAKELPPIRDVKNELPIAFTRDEYRTIGRAAVA